MCGIAGLINCLIAKDDLSIAIARMTDNLIHRGPDGEGHWVDHSGRVALGHRRLAILDLTSAGAQPMVSASGRYVIVLNGELYNYRQLKEELKTLGCTFISNSDTEVLLEAVEQWGFAEALKKIAGMFALAVYDNQNRRLYLARDRIGEKPIYFGQEDGYFFFASELKALRALTCFTGRVDRNALALFMRYNYIPSPYSIFEGVRKLEPGTYLEIDTDISQFKIKQFVYWSLKNVVESQREMFLIENQVELFDRFDSLLRSVVQEQMVADVPVGAFLSGGIDSTLVVAVMQALSREKVKTFTIGFDEKGFNEAGHAAAVAKHLGTDHSELYIGPDDLLSIVPYIPQYYDEPFADSSLLPTCLVARLAKKQVKVVLSGDGGDELFGGYNTYSIGQRVWSGFRKTPLPLRKLGAGIIDLFSRKSLDNLLKIPEAIGGKGFWLDGERIKILAELLPSTSKEILYKNLVSKWINPQEVVLNSQEPETVFTTPGMWPDAALSFVEWMMYVDALSYLPDNNLVKVDRACMASSLESRVPLLDYRIIEYAWQLPFEYKVQGNERKWLLKKLLAQYVPKELIDRPKMGFGVPIEHWLRGPLKDWAGDLLSEARIKREGYFDYRPIEKQWSEHIKGERNRHYSLWSILMFQAWLD